MSERSLPAHIEAALQGNLTDSAGRPWAGRDLSGEKNPLHRFEDDDGACDPGYACAIAGLRQGRVDEPAIISALAAARVFIPVVAQLGAASDGVESLPADKEADMVLATLRAPDGRLALPVFSTTDALEHWHPQARPVAVYAARAALAAVAEQADLMVVDPGADLTFVVRRPAVWALARQQEWVPAYQDPQLAELITPLVDAEPALRAMMISAGSGVSSRTSAGDILPGGGAGPELRLAITLVPGLSAAGVQAITARLRASLQSERAFVERVDSLEITVSG